MIKAFISHSSKQKDFAIELVKFLGRDYCIIDCYNFESAYKTIDQIYNSIEEASVFVLLISRESLASDWVNEEIQYAKAKMTKSQYDRFWPFIVDNTMSLEDCPEWMHKGECFNLKKFASPRVLARDIEQKFRKIIWSTNPMMKALETTMVGRNEEISLFEDKFQSSRGMKLRALIISGRDGVGKDTFAKQCLYKVGYPLEQEPYRINLGVKDNVENFIIELNMITEFYNEIQLRNVLVLDPKSKSEIAVQLLNKLYETGSVVFVDDNMACVLPNRSIPEWIADIIGNESLNPQLGLLILSYLTPSAYVEAEYDGLAHIPLSPLNKKDRLKLFFNYARLYGLSNLTDDDANFFVERLLHSPTQIHQAVQAIKTTSLLLAKKDIDSLISIGDAKIRPLLNRYKEEEQRDLLIILSKFDFISYELLEDIYDERIKETLDIIIDMMVYGIVSSFGPSNSFFRLDHYVSDYIKRNKFTLSKDLEIHVNDVLEKRIKDSVNITEDTSLYLYDVKNKIVSGRGTSESFLIPSIIVKSVIEIYHNRDYKLVIEICDKVLQDSHCFYSDVARELQYWLCLALCRIKDGNRFKKEVMSINGADYWFLEGFYLRNVNLFDKAEIKLREALKHSPSMQRAKRELVTVLLAQHKYPEALNLAQENFERDPDNSYHIHAYFRCLVKKHNLTRVDVDMLNQLMSAMKVSFSDKKEELFAAMNIEFQAYIVKLPPADVLNIIHDAEQDFPDSINIQRAADNYKYKQNIINTLKVYSEEI